MLSWVFRRVCLLLALLLVAWQGEAGAVERLGTDEAATLRDLIALEPGFQDFLATPLDASSPARSLDGLEREIERLIELRNLYLEALLRHPRNSYSALIMVRVAEAHLDLAARARALPAPLDASEDNTRAFYELTEVYAGPLEDAGLSILEQIDRFHFDDERAAPWVARARLYLALHAGERHPRHRAAVVALRRRAGGDLRFAPPRSLLDSPHLSPRAARLLP